MEQARPVSKDSGDWVGGGGGSKINVRPMIESRKCVECEQQRPLFPVQKHIHTCSCMECSVTTHKMRTFRRDAGDSGRES
jgi:hypothetical protein